MSNLDFSVHGTTTPFLTSVLCLTLVSFRQNDWSPNSFIMVACEDYFKRCSQNFLPEARLKISHLYAGINFTHCVKVANTPIEKKKKSFITQILKQILCVFRFTNLVHNFKKKSFYLVKSIVRRLGARIPIPWQFIIFTDMIL